MTLPIERFKDAYFNWRYNPFTDEDMAVVAVEDGLIIPSGSPFIIQLLEQPRYNDPTQVAVRCYGVDTFVDETSASGQPILKVDDTTGFSDDDTVIINRGGAREEERIIASVQVGVSLTMTVNLEFEHTAGQADVVEKYIAFTHTAGAPAQSQFRVDYPTGDGGKGTGLVEFNTNDATKEVRISYKATGSPALAETLDTKVSYPAGSPGEGKIIGFISGAPQWKDNPEPHVLASDRHTASGLTVGHVIRASGAAAFAWAQLQHGDLGGVSANQHHPQAHTLASHSTKPHSALTGIGTDDHHPQVHTHASHSGIGINDHHLQAHTLASHSTKPHNALTGIGSGDHHPQVHALTSHSDFATYLNQAVLTTSNIIHNNGLFNGKLSFGNATELTIDDGTITVTRSYHIVDTEGDDALDNLQTINGGVDGMLLFLRPANNARTIHVRESGNIKVDGIYQPLESMYATIMLLYDVGRGKWMQVGYANNEA